MSAPGRPLMAGWAWWAWVTAALLALAALLGHGGVRAEDAMPALAARIAALAADPAIVRLRADNVGARMRSIVPLQADPPSQAERSFSGQAPGSGIAWARVDFQAGSRAGSWHFLQLQIGLDATSAQFATLGPAVARDLARRLGKPTAPPSGKAERLRTWRLSAGRVVSVREGSFASPIDDRRQAVVLVEVVVEQGEPDNVRSQHRLQAVIAGHTALFTTLSH